MSALPNNRRTYRVTKAWKVSHHAIQPVTTRYPDGRVVVSNPEPIKRKRKQRTKPVRKAQAITPSVVATGLTREERIAKEYEILSRFDSYRPEQYL